MSIVKVALINNRLKEPLDYQISSQDNVEVGCRVLVPLGNKQVVGIIVACNVTSDLEIDTIKHIVERIDEKSLWATIHHDFLLWAAQYYQVSIGKVYASAIPKWLKEGRCLTSINLEKELILSACKDGEKLISSRAKKQLSLWSWLNENGPRSVSEIQQAGFVKSIWETMLLKKYIYSFNVKFQAEKEKKFTSEQSTAYDQLSFDQGFFPMLLDGVTGSGKTEVYLQWIAKVLAKGQSVLLLVPEIGLTPQMISRVKKRFEHILVLHSDRADQDRVKDWLFAGKISSAVIVGTRSSIWVPITNLGLIIVDEEHDESFYEQSSSFRYNARDVAVMRAKMHNIPVVLGSATPSLESYYQVKLGKYYEAILGERVYKTSMPSIKMVSLLGEKLQCGVSEEVLLAAKQQLRSQRQVLFFLNRRGFSDVLMCHKCGWIDKCLGCDRSYVVHQYARVLKCHHCNFTKPIPVSCEECKSHELICPGNGTERLESFLTKQFPNYPVLRMDRDTVTKRGEREKLLSQLANDKAAILIGTQMVAKGHHFANLHMVVILDMDSNLYHPDIRSEERTAQLLVQVMGRAGREKERGLVYIQSHQVDNAFYQAIRTQSYRDFAHNLLASEYREVWPPYVYSVRLEAVGRDKGHVQDGIAFIANALNLYYKDDIVCLGPVPNIIPKTRGLWSFQCLLRSSKRSALFTAVRYAQDLTLQVKGVRFLIDIDPCYMIA